MKVSAIAYHFRAFTILLFVVCATFFFTNVKAQTLNFKIKAENDSAIVANCSVRILDRSSGKEVVTKKPNREGIVSFDLPYTGKFIIEIVAAGFKKNESFYNRASVNPDDKAYFTIHLEHI